jgi:hypothetical protein
VIFLHDAAAMKLVGWLRFTWESKMLPSASYLITEEYSIRRATKHEKTQAWQVINSCFLLDTCWNDVLDDLLPQIRHDFEEKFSHREIDCLVITHGNRTIGASLSNLRRNFQTIFFPAPASRVSIATADSDHYCSKSRF